jgi:hypothetical protein
LPGGRSPPGFVFSKVNILNILPLARLLALLAVALVAPLVNAQRPFSTTEELGRWVTYYYLKPEPFRIPGAVVAASRLGMLKDLEATQPFFGFIAGVLEKEPSIAHFLVERMDQIAEPDRPVVILGIWYSGHADTPRLLETISKRFPKHKPMISKLKGRGLRLVQIPLERGAWLVDALWGYFMATGEELPVTRIVSTLPWSELKDSPTKVATAESARWSLAANAAQHARVKEILVAQQNSQPPEVAGVLKEIIAKAGGSSAKKSESGTDSAKIPKAPH